MVFETVERNIRHWVWAGEEWEVEQIIAKLDDDTRNEEEQPETLDVKTLLSWLKDAVLEVQEAAVQTAAVNGNGHAPIAVPVVFDVAGVEVDMLIEAADSVSLFMAESRSTWERMKKRFLTPPTVAAPPAPEPKPEPTVEPESETPRLNDARFEDLLANYNAVRAERDRLLEDLKIARRRADTTAAELSVKQMNTQELKLAKQSNERLLSQLSAAKAAIEQHKKGVGTPPEVKEHIKDACAKVCDDQAASLARTKIPRLEEQAEDLRRLAVEIRALKI